MRVFASDSALAKNPSKVSLLCSSLMCSLSFPTLAWPALCPTVSQPEGTKEKFGVFEYLSNNLNAL